MKQQKNINLVPGSFSNNRPYSPIQQQKSTLQRKNSALLSVRQSSSNRSGCITQSQRNVNKGEQYQSNISSNTNNRDYETLQKQDQDDDDNFQFLQDKDVYQIGRDQNMHQETFRNSQSNNNDFQSNKVGKQSLSQVRQSHQQLQITPQVNEQTSNKENVNNYNTQESKIKKIGSTDSLNLKTKQKQYYSNASAVSSQQIIQNNNVVKEKCFKSEQNQIGFQQNQNDNKSKSRSPSYRQVITNSINQLNTKSPSPINSKNNQLLTNKSLQNSSANTQKQNKAACPTVNDKQTTNKNKNSNKSSIQKGNETPKITAKQSSSSQFNLGYSPILKMDKGEFCNNQGDQEDDFDGDENSDIFNFNKYSAKMANNIIENILDKDDIYERTRQENKSYKEMMKEKQVQINRLEQQVKLLQVQNQEMTKNMALEKERYQNELINFSEKIQRLKNIQTLYMEEKQNSENIEQNLNKKQKIIQEQQNKLHQMVDWIFKTYSCLIVTKNSSNFEQDDLEYIWSQMTNLIRILSDEIMQVQLESSLKQLLKQPLKLINESQSNMTQLAEQQITTNSSQMSLAINNKPLNNNVGSTFRDIYQRNNSQKDVEVNVRLPFFAINTEESLSENTLQKNSKETSKIQSFTNLKTEQNTNNKQYPIQILNQDIEQNNELQFVVAEEEDAEIDDNDGSQILTDIKIINESEQTIKNCIKKDLQYQPNEIKVERQLIFESEIKEEDSSARERYSESSRQENKEYKDDYVIAVFDYVAQKDKDLSFKKGDKIQVIKRTKNGWWIGLLNKNIGYFPFNYVNEVKK